MKIVVFVSLLSLALASGRASAQALDPTLPMTNMPAAPRPHVIDVPQPVQASAAPTDPAKIADFEKRFAQGKELEDAGKLTEARAVFDGIIADSPDAKGSLREAGIISVRLNELDKADDYFSKLHRLVPDYPAAIESLIQINQALKHDVKVELLIRDFTELRASGKIPDLAASLCFVRERIHSDQQEIVISQFFDYTVDPNTVWMAEVFDASGALKRRILLNFDPDTTRGLRARDEKYAHTQVFTWFEHILKDGQVKEIDAYLQIFALPDYQKFRSATYVILANPPKPIYTAPVGAPAQ